MPWLRQRRASDEAIGRKYKDKFTFVFRNKIIPGHQNSRAAASFAEAAGLQGKYFEMHDKLYDNQKPGKPCLLTKPAQTTLPA